MAVLWGVVACGWVPRTAVSVRKVGMLMLILSHWWQDMLMSKKKMFYGSWCLVTDRIALCC